MNTERKPVDVLAVMLALIVEVDADENPNLNDAGIEARDSVSEMIADLRTIADLDPEQTPSGNNEWGEAECFGVAKRIARAALARCGVKS